MKPNKITKVPDIIRKESDNDKNKPDVGVNKEEEKTQTEQPEPEEKKKNDPDEPYVDFSQLFFRDKSPI